MAYENNDGNDENKNGKASASTEQNHNPVVDTHMTDISDKEPPSSPTLNLKYLSTPAGRPWPAICESSWRTALLTPTETSSTTPKRLRYTLLDAKLRHISPLRLKQRQAQAGTRAAGEHWYPKVQVCSDGTEIPPQQTKHYRCSRDSMLWYACWRATVEDTLPERTIVYSWQAKRHERPGLADIPDCINRITIYS